jgi:hypothetical protein
MPVANSIKAQLDDAKYVMRRQMARIAELEQENERLKEGLSAHGVLRSIYSDETQPTGHRIKAAIGSLPHETPKLQSVPPPLELVAEPVIPLADLVTQRRARMNRILALSLEERAALIPGCNDGNGSNGSGNDHGSE